MREHGSGNAGTTNAFRVLGARWVTVVLVGDVLKGFLPVLLARVPVADRWWSILVATGRARRAQLVALPRAAGGARAWPREPGPSWR